MTGICSKRAIGASTAVALGRNVRPQNHDQEDQDRIQHDPRDVGSPTPFLLYGLPAHGELSPFNGLRNQIELFAKFRAVSRYGHDFNLRDPQSREPRARCEIRKTQEIAGKETE
jgi:hypothetical protein